MLNEGIIITNKDHRILFVNSRFVEMTGIPQQDLLGADAAEFYSAEELGVSGPTDCCCATSRPPPL